MAVTLEPVRRRFTIEEYDRMVEAGVLRADERVELIDGELIEMSPIGKRHAACVANLNRLLFVTVGSRAVVWPQNPVAIPTPSKPQPDLALLRARSYMTAEVTTDDILLIIEVADTSFRFDRTVKGALYARAGIPEYWLVDANAERVTVFRGPSPDGYLDVQGVLRSGTLCPMSFPEVAITVADVFS